MTKKSALLLIVPLMLAGCGAPSAGPAVPPVAAEAKYAGEWTLVEGRSDESPVPIVAGYPLTLTLDPNGPDGGNAACNTYGLDATIEGDAFAAEPTGVTEIGCAARVLVSQDRFLNALVAAQRIEVDAKRMTLSGPDSLLVFERVPPLAESELVDTRWELNALLEGQGPDGIASSVQGGYLVISSDGRLQGSTGCRPFEGKWTRVGEHIQTVSFGVQGDCPEEQRQQNDHVVDVLGDGFTVQIEQNQLTLYNIRGEQGLLFVERTR